MGKDSLIENAKYRREILRYSGVLGTFALAGCSSEPQTGTPAADTQSPTEGSGDGGGEAMTDTPAGEQAKSGGTLRVGIPEDIPPRFDTRTAADTPGFNWTIMGSITTWDLQGQVKPHLAKDWTFENDGTELVFDLMEGVKFHDGSDFNAEYVKWHLEDFLANGTGTSYIVEPVDEVVVEDTHRARVMFSSPDPYILWDLASGWGQIHSREAVEEYGDEYGQSGKVVSTGPFKEVEHSSSHAVLERFEDFAWPDPWHEEQYPDLFEDPEVLPGRVEIEVFPEEATRTSAIEAGDIDVAMGGVPYNKLPDYEERDDINTGSPPVDTEQLFVILNLDPETSTSPILASDLALRKGISYAIDREAIIQAVFNGAGTVAPNYVVPATQAYDVPEEYHYTFDIEKAKSVMEEGGWTVNPDGVSTKDGDEAEFTLLAQTTGNSRKRATLWKQFLTKIGVQVNITMLDISSFKDRVGNDDFAAAMSTFYGWGNADLLWWFNAEGADPTYYLNSNSYRQFPKVTELTNHASNAPTLEERAERYKEAHKYILDNVVPCVYTVYPQQIDGWQPHIKNWKPWFKGAPMWPVWSENW